MICVNGKKNLMLLLDYLRMFERACFDKLNMTNARLNMTNERLNMANASLHMTNNKSIEC